jgi:hypothetical protein
MNNSDTYKMRAISNLLIKPRDIRVVDIESYLRRSSNYSRELLSSIHYSITTPAPYRYYYHWVKSLKPNLCIDQKALLITKEPLLIDYKNIYNSELPTVIKVKEEIIWMIK